MKKTLLSMLLAGSLGVFSVSASAIVMQDFQVQEGSVPGVGTSNLFTADKITGGYNEQFSVTAPGEFATAAYWSAGQYYANDGTQNVAGIPGQDVYLGSAGSVGYNMYALEVRLSSPVAMDRYECISTPIRILSSALD